MQVEERVIPNIDEFVMPPLKTGAIVSWYKDGVRLSRKPVTAVVCSVGTRTVSIHVLGVGRMDAVRHIEDPKLMLNPDQRESGAWDYSEDQRDIYYRLEQLGKRLDAIDKKIGEIFDSMEIERALTTEERSENLSAVMGEYWKLVARAREMGIVWNKSGRPTKKWLTDEINAKEAQDGQG